MIRSTTTSSRYSRTTPPSRPAPSKVSRRSRSSKRSIKPPLVYEPTHPSLRGHQGRLFRDEFQGGNDGEYLWLGQRQRLFYGPVRRDPEGCHHRRSDQGAVACLY